MATSVLLIKKPKSIVFDPVPLVFTQLVLKYTKEEASFSHSDETSNNQLRKNFSA